jgi:two-component system response regulator
MNELDVVEVLLVEDNPQDAELTMRTLKKRNLANHLVLVEDGAAALDFMFGQGKYSERNPAHLPKAVLLDLKLPKLNGLEVLRALKADPRTRSVPVVIITSSAQDPDVETAYKLGANSYVVKPVSFDAFTEAMSTIGYYWLLVNQFSKAR